MREGEGRGRREVPSHVRWKVYNGAAAAAAAAGGQSRGRVGSKR